MREGVTWDAPTGSGEDFALGAVQETLLGQAFEHAPVGVVVFDEFGGFVAANRSAAAFCGYTRQEFLALGSHRLLVDDSIADRLQEMASGERTAGRAAIRRKDGSALEVEYRVGETRVGGLPFLVSVFWPAQDAGRSE